MMYKNSTPNLMVKNVKQTVNFYIDVLGFNLIDSVPSENDDSCVFAIVQADNVLFMFQEEKSLKDELPQLANCTLPAPLTFYTNVTDVHALYSKLKGKVIIVKDMHDTFYGTTDFAIEDCNGYILVFSQNNK